MEAYYVPTTSYIESWKKSGGGDISDPDSNGNAVYYYYYYYSMFYGRILLVSNVYGIQWYRDRNKNRRSFIESMLFSSSFRAIT